MYCRYDEKNGCIILQAMGSYEYYVDLDRCKTSAQCLDWIHQVNSKTWATPELVKEFATALFEHIDRNLWSGA